MNVPEHEQSPLTDLKPGDIITAYVKGFHEVVAVERRYHTEKDFADPYHQYPDGRPHLKGKKLGDEASPIIYYRRRLSRNGNKAPNQICCCDLSFCEKLTQDAIYALFLKGLTAAQKVKSATELLIAEQQNGA